MNIQELQLKLNELQCEITLAEKTKDKLHDELEKLQEIKESAYTEYQKEQSTRKKQIDTLQEKVEALETSLRKLSNF